MNADTLQGLHGLEGFPPRLRAYIEIPRAMLKLLWPRTPWEPGNKGTRLGGCRRSRYRGPVSLSALSLPHLDERDEGSDDDGCGRYVKPRRLLDE